MSPVRRKITQQTSFDFHKNPPTPCSKACDVSPEMKIYLFQCIENHLKTIYLGISDSRPCLQGVKVSHFKCCVKTINRSRSSVINIYRYALVWTPESDQNQNQNQNSLLVKRQTDNTTPGGMGLDRRGLVPSSHKRSKFRHTII